ncbi:MAG: cache domain-containing protein [Spirochaetaceae bacterium]
MIRLGVARRKPRASVRRKLLNLLLYVAIPLALLLAVVVGSLGVRMWRDSLLRVETMTAVLHDAVDTTLQTSIESYLRAKVETAMTTIDSVRSSMPADGTASPEDVIAERLLDISVADSGYIYVIDGDGRVVIHPDADTQGRVVPEVEPVRTQLEKRRGYIEYSWRNSFEPSPQPKALYMDEHERLGWIVSASSYRSEFVQLVDRGRVTDMIETVLPGVEAYSVVVDSSGRFVFHPEYEGRRMTEFFGDSEAERLKDVMFSEEKGRLRYSWPVRPGGRRRPKMMLTRYLPAFDWAVATTVYLDSLLRPTVLVLGAGGVLLLVSVMVLLWWVLRMSHVVSDPIVRLADAARGDRRLSTAGFSRETPRELITLIDQFNAFVGRIDAQQREVAAQQEDLRRSLEEKTVLVREIHHRVKNNLQVIASLLNLQAGSVRDRDDAALFHRTAERVVSMALVHEQLYETEDLSLIPFDRYLDELIGHIQASSGRDGVVLRVECEPIALEIERAVPCGLIVNELVTNSLQHAFSRSSGGTIRVQMLQRGNIYTLEIADSGCGMPDEARKSLGMTLVEMLAEQIGGEVEVGGEVEAGGDGADGGARGARVTVTFPV